MSFHQKANKKANPLAPPVQSAGAQAQQLRLLHTSLTPSNSNGLVQKNRVLVWQDIRYHYDSLGRVTRKISGQRQDLRIYWNAENQITCTISERKGQSSTTRYHYDGLGRRIAVQTQNSAQHGIAHPGEGLSALQRQMSIATSWFTWSGMRLLQQEWPENSPKPEKSWTPKHSASALTHTYLYTEEGSYEPLARIEHGLSEAEITAQAIQYFHTDINGAPEELTAATGEIQWQLRYSTWGSAVMEQWWPSQDEPELAKSHPQRISRLYPRVEQAFEGQHAHQQNLRYQGQYLDRDTGLHYNTFRYYDADMGRFVCQDPIGLAGGMNLYQYAPNALDWIDPWGWRKKSPPGTYRRERNDHTGGETNHSPARNSFEHLPDVPSYGQSPAFHMDTDDHRRMTSTGSSRAADRWRRKQEGFIRQGRWDRAMEMDIKEASRLFPGKYADRMKRMIDYAKSIDLMTSAQAKRLKKLCR